MLVKVVKRDKESNERCITRFIKAVTGSRKTLKIRTSRYHKKAPTKRQIRANAKARDNYRAIREKHKFY